MSGMCYIGKSVLQSCRKVLQKRKKLLPNVHAYAIIYFVEVITNSILAVIRLHGQAVKTSPFHGGNTGSIPVGVIALCDSRKGLRTFSSVG